MANKNNQWRVFIAIPLSFKNREILKLSLLQSVIQLPERIVNPSGWHITIYFIGSLKNSKVLQLVDLLSVKVWPKKFDLILDHLGAFPDAENAQVIWYGISKGQTALYELAEEVSQVLYKLGFEPDPRSFSGHLTLCRLQKPRDMSALLKTPVHSVHLPVDRFVLFRSHLELGSQQYEELASFNLEST